MAIKLNWKFEDGKHALYRQGSKTPMLWVVPDQTAMWRILDRKGNLSDMANIARIKDLQPSSRGPSTTPKRESDSP